MHVQYRAEARDVIFKNASWLGYSAGNCPQKSRCASISLLGSMGTRKFMCNYFHDAKPTLRIPAQSQRAGWLLYTSQKEYAMQREKKTKEH